jgi:hypothetical protein
MSSERLLIRRHGCLIQMTLHDMNLLLRYKNALTRPNIGSIINYVSSLGVTSVHSAGSVEDQTTV